MICARQYRVLTAWASALTVPLGILILLPSGCQVSAPNVHPEAVIGDLQSRSRPPLPPGGKPPAPAETEIIEVADGLTEEEAILIALRKNADFQAALDALGIAWGDVVQAGLLTNPLFSTFLPLGPKQWEWTLTMPIEAILLRPHRVAIARSDYERIGKELVDNGLNLIRDVRRAFADLRFAQERAELAKEAVQARKDIYDLSQKRLQAGDISELEATNARIEWLRAQAEAANLEQNVPLAMNNLRTLLGLTFLKDHFVVIPEKRAILDHPPKALIEMALAARPDLRAAEIAIENAREQAGLARWAFVEFAGLIDANSQGDRGFEVGPGALLRVPLLNRNEGGRLRAHAQIEQNIKLYEARRQTAVRDILAARIQVKQAKDNLRAIRAKVIPALKEARGLAEKAYQGGGASYFLVLQTVSDYLAARAQELQLIQAAEIAFAELERSVGRRLDFVPPLKPLKPKLILPPPQRSGETIDKNHPLLPIDPDPDPLRLPGGGQREAPSREKTSEALAPAE